MESGLFAMLGILATIGIIILLVGLIFYIIQGIVLTKLHTKIYGKGTVLAWIPLANSFIAGKLAFNQNVGILLVVGAVIGTQFTLTVNGVRQTFGILPDPIRSFATFATGIMGLVCFIKCIIMLGNKDLKPVVTQASVANFDTETGERINNFDPMTGEKIVQHPVQPQEQITNNVQLQEQVTNDVQLQEQVTNDVQLQEQAITQTNSVVGGETTETSVQSSAILPEPIENKENVNSSIPKDLYGDKSVIGNTSTGSITKYNAGESSIHVCKNCTNCGTKLYIKKGFCPDCGTPIPEEKETNQ